jgi:acetyl-CoA/propionyl-CoA carboxylase
MTEAISQMFITGPNVIAEAVHQTITKEDLGGAQIHAQISGVAHMVCPTEADCFAQVKTLLSYLPQSYMDQAPTLQQHAPQPTNNKPLSYIVPTNHNQSYNIKDAITSIVDTESFFEIHKLFAPNIITGFARMDDIVVGIVANQPLIKAGTIDIEASCKAARFIRFCDRFGIPIITLVDTPGYLPASNRNIMELLDTEQNFYMLMQQQQCPK